MAYCRNDQRVVLQLAALCAFATVTCCSLDSSPKTPGPNEPPPVERGKPTARDAPPGERDLDGSVRDADIKVSTGQQRGSVERDAGKKLDAGKADEPQQPATPARTLDAGSPPSSGSQAQGSDASTSPPATTQEPAMTMVDGPCARMRLKERAEAYLRAMATGDTASIRVHPSFRYTENGRDERLGAGAWTRRAESEFSRHVLDETRCSAVTQAVMKGVAGRFSFGVRLRYVEDQLLEAEAQVVPEALADTDLNAVIPVGSDPWVAEVPPDTRMSREALFDLAMRYFDSVSGVSMVPPSSPNCRRRQNGVPIGDGSCARPPGNVRFEQQRFDVADEPNGIVTATILYQNHIGLYLLKISDNTIQSIETIGGATSQTTGW